MKKPWKKLDQWTATDMFSSSYSGRHRRSNNEKGTLEYKVPPS
jgi:hypothetical protein